MNVIIPILIVLAVAGVYLWRRKQRKAAAAPKPVTVPGPVQDPTHDLPDPPKKGGQIP